MGESPIVVTSMVHALQAKKGLEIDQLHVIHPPNNERFIRDAYQLVADHFNGRCTVNPCELSFPDTNSRQASIEFLQILSDLIQRHEREQDNIFLSLAGGRKNMSALMAVTCQFFPCVRGLYHILDKYEDNSEKRNFYSTEYLWLNFEETERAQKLSPPAEDLILVEIPYSPLLNSVDLSEYLNELEGEPAAFYREILREEKTDLLDVYLSEEANRFYTRQRGSQKNLENCFRSMRNPQTLQIHNHSLSNPRTDCLCFKMGRTDERLFYYKIDSRVIIATIVRHNNRFRRIANGNEPLWSEEHPAYIHSNKLRKENNILIATLGKSPMVVTQTFKLLSQRESVHINRIIAIHPHNSKIRAGVRMLKTAFRDTGCRVESVEINTITDIASKEDCNLFLEKLVSVIQKEKMDNPDNSIRLSLSGGRKGMAALTLFAAQQANIDAVYHTLTTDAALERQIEEETTLEALQRLSRPERAKHLFLESYDESKFELFRVPVPQFHRHWSLTQKE